MVDVVHHEDSGNGALVAVLVIVVIGLAAFFAYKQGLLTGEEKDPQPIEINLPGGSPSAQ